MSRISISIFVLWILTVFAIGFIQRKVGYTLGYIDGIAETVKMVEEARGK